MDGQCRHAARASRWAGRQFAAAVLAARLLVGGGVAAQEGAPAPAAATPSAAIGRLNFAGFRDTRHCTMFAIGPRTVVTAAHCLRGQDPAEGHLLFGYAAMEWAAHLAPLSARDLGNDVAVLCLAEPAPAVLPLGPEADPAPGTPLAAIGYGMPVRHRQTRSDCPLARTGRTGEGRAMVLSCPQAPGASGGPVLGPDGGAIAVISATTRTEVVAMRIPPEAAAACTGG